MQLDEKRKERQELGVDKWFDNNCKGILDYAPGVGKTFTAFLAIQRIEENERGSYLVGVPSDALVKQWNDKIKEFFPKYIGERIIVKTYNKLCTENLVYEVDTFVLDEIHEAATEERIKLLQGVKIKARRILGLTASGDDKNFRAILKYLKIIDTISVEEGKELGFTADFIEYNLGLELTPKERELYDVYTNTINTLLPKFANNIQLAQKVMSGGKDPNNQYFSGAGWAMALAYKQGWRRDLNLNHAIHKQIDDFWNPKFFAGWATRLMNAVRNRSFLLYNATAKYNTTVEILKTFDKVKTIVFSESTDFADKLGVILSQQKYPAAVYHSKLKTKMVTSPKSGKLIKYGAVRQKREAVEAIRMGKVKAIVTTKALDRGLDVEDIRMSITTSGTQNPTQYKQRGGRSTRKEVGSIFADLPVLLINLYMVDTQDEIWLDRRQSQSSHKIISVNSVKEIGYTPPSNKEFTLDDI